jgi:DNA-directed RNA polymerase subunit beta
LRADEEEAYRIAPRVARDGDGAASVDARHRGDIVRVSAADVDLTDATAVHVLAAAAATIPFVEHDDPTRALMGANMQRQAVPLVEPEPPVVQTSLGARVVEDAESLVRAAVDGVVVATHPTATGGAVVVRDAAGSCHPHPFVQYSRSPQGTLVHQRACVRPGEHVRAGDLLAEGSAAAGGSLAHGRNVLVAFAALDGANFEDAVVVSQRLVDEDLFTSIHVDEYRCTVLDTPHGAEEVTAAVPGLSASDRAPLSAEGIVPIGRVVRPGDVLVGKRAPRPAPTQSPTDRLWHAVLADDGVGWRDTSTRVPMGAGGTVIDARILDRAAWPEAPPHVRAVVLVRVARTARLAVGDKIAGRHGNKGVVAHVRPVEDMPYLPDGTPVDMVVNPLGVVARMNVGQVLETHVGWAAATAGYRADITPFAQTGPTVVADALRAAGLPIDGKSTLYDGRSGEPLDRAVTVGVMYVMKLAHMAASKAHARSIGPYNLLSQQPVGGRTHRGGQRLGEMEIWALEAHGASSLLHESLTIRSDDRAGREAAYAGMVRGAPVPEPGQPESVALLVRYLRAVGVVLDPGACTDASAP